MSSWFSRVRAPKPSPSEGDKLDIPGGMWKKCPACSAILYQQEVLKSSHLCPKCSHHFRINCDQRISLLVDTGTFVETDAELESPDPLSFKDSTRYKDRLKQAQKKTGSTEAVRTGRATIGGKACMIGVFNFFFMGGSMGMVVGEKLVRMIERAVDNRLPVIIVSASGGARMQEGIYSLMQMARVSAALERLGRQRLPYLSVLTDPTTGGVAASFAMLGDIIISEPGALIGFAGPRVIEQTIGKSLPEGFQRAEFLLEHGMLDIVADRRELKSVVAKCVSYLTANTSALPVGNESPRF